MKCGEKTIERSPAIWIRMRFRSFGYAWNGIVQFFRTESNAQLHLAATVIVVALSAWFRLTMHEAVIILFAVGFVWVTEMLNTAIEKALDFISVQRHPQIKFIKDVAAGAVLIASTVAAIAGLVIFIPKIFTL